MGDNNEIPGDRGEKRSVKVLTGRKNDSPLGVGESIKTETVEIRLVVEDGAKRDVDTSLLVQHLKRKGIDLMAMRLERGTDEQETLIKRFAARMKGTRQKNNHERLYIG